MSTAKILIVDDAMLFLELEKSFLKNSPVRIFIAHDGEEALAIAKKEYPDLIYMDLNMPKMDGVACCTAIKANPVLCSIPVIMVTTAGKEEDVALCRQAGCDDFLTKPIDRRLFLEKGRRFIPGIDRRDIRVPCRTAVTFRVNRVTLSGLCFDISTSGIYLEANYEVGEDSAIDVSFTLPDLNGTLIQAKGRVAWSNAGRERKKTALLPGFGVEFVDLDDKVMAAVTSYIEAMRS